MAAVLLPASAATAAMATAPTNPVPSGNRIANTAAVERAAGGKPSNAFMRLRVSDSS